MQRLAAVLALAALLALPLGADLLARPEDEPSPEIERRELKDWLKYLADDEREGREAGTPGCYAAAERIAQEYQRLGLKPAGAGGGWFQPFTKPKGTKVLETTALSAADATGKTQSFRLAEDFAPVDISAAGEVSAAAVFAGYGIAAPDLGYDDYAGLDVKGKVVVVLRYAPRWQDKRKSPFAPQSVMVRHGTFKAKADAAAERGAAALVVINDPASHGSTSDDKLRQPGGSTTGKIPVVHMTWRAAKKLGRRIGVPFVRRQRAIDGRFNPRSEACEGTTVHVKCDLAPDIRNMRNVAGLLEPEAGPVTAGQAAPAVENETFVIGAHYDHVGWGHFGSLANAEGKIHNGADDNASGTTALLEIAGFLVDRRAVLKRRVLFVAFSGEELGLLGSKHYVREPLVPIADTVAMLNLDMVGRLEKNRLFVGGTGTSPVWPGMLERLNRSEGRFELTLWPGGKAPSDHASFYEANLPVLFFFTGLHSDYHRPSDDWNTIEYAGLERVTRFAASVALELSALEERPQFTRCDAGGFTVGPYVGIAVEQRDDGVYVAHVDKKSPARKAGFRVDDRIAEWNKVPVPSTTRYNDIVSKAKAGDRVEVIVIRSGKRRRLKLKMGRT